MIYIHIGIVLAIAALAIFLKKRPAQADQQQTVAAAPAPTPVSAARAKAAPRQPGAAHEMPAALATFQFVRHDELNPEHRRALLDSLRHIPRPASSLEQLVSQNFMTQATNKELNDLVMSNPLLAAKVLATVNSPFYGLQVPVSSVGQAITFLGFNTVRSIGMRYILGDTFKSTNPELNRTLDVISAASAIATELCIKLAQKLNLANQGTLSTYMVLSFIGQLASSSLMQLKRSSLASGQGLLEKTMDEQSEIGLGSAEIGALLMKDWDLPEAIVEEVRNIDRVLVTPAQAAGERAAFCYVCIRLGERLAQGTLKDLSRFDFDDGQDADWFHLRSYLRLPALERLPAYLQAPEVLAAVKCMQDSLPTMMGKAPAA